MDIARTRILAMVLPLSLIFCAIGAATALAIGTRAGWARHSLGLNAIVLARQLQWPLVGLALVFSIVLQGLVISGKRRAWWLIGLGPVLALLVARFAAPAQDFGALENPQFVEATSSAAPRDDEWVVGLIFCDRAYAFPYRALAAAPLLVVTDYDKRLLLMWSAEANRATAVNISHEFRPRDLEIVSRPMGSLLVLNRRYGQFIVAVTGRTTTGGDPVGFGSAIAATKTSWRLWRARYPRTQVMAIPLAGADAPSEPVAPDARANSNDEMRIAIVATTPPLAVPSGQTLDHPVLASTGNERLLIVRDPQTGALRAFDRRVGEDLVPAFKLHRDRRKPQAALIDADTASLWTIGGSCLEGELKGHRLREIAVEEGLWLGIMHYWYPELRLAW